MRNIELDSLRKYIKFIVLFLLAAALLWWFARSLNWEEVKATLARANIWLLILAASCVCFGYLVRAFRWRTLLAPLTHANLRELFATTTIGFSAVFLLGRMGEIVRPVALPLREKNVSPSMSFVTIGLERICDMMAVVVVFAINLIWFRAPAGRTAEEFAVVQKAGLILFGLVAVGIISLLLFRAWSRAIVGFFEKLLARLSFIPRRLSNLLLGMLKHLAEALGILVDWRELAMLVLWTSLLWTAVSVATWLVLKAFHLPFGFSDALFVMGWALVGSLVPTPGGAAGAFHEATARGLIFLNLDRNESAAIAIIMHLVYFAPATLFGFYYFLRGDVSLSRLKELITSDDAEHLLEAKDATGEKGKEQAGESLGA